MGSAIRGRVVALFALLVLSAIAILYIVLRGPRDGEVTAATTGRERERATERPQLAAETDSDGSSAGAAGSSAGAAGTGSSTGASSLSADAGASMDAPDGAAGTPSSTGSDSPKPKSTKAQLRGHLATIDAQIKACAREAVTRGAKHTGRVTLTFIAGRDKTGGVTIESTGDDDEESTIKNDDALVGCLHPLTKPFVVELPDDGVAYMSVHWAVDIKDGEVTYVGPTSFTNRRDGEGPTD